MTLILPPRISPATSVTQRRHQPKPSEDYRKYRNCLRWEFGFTCPFCLQHELDIVAHGAEGFGLFSIDHRRPQKTHPHLKTSYANCVYVCQRCNRAKSISACVDSQGRELLCPTEVVWSDHFLMTEDEFICAKPNDRDAAYTVEVYRPNEPKKLEGRRRRRRDMEGRKLASQRARDREKEVLAILSKGTLPADTQKKLLDLAQQLSSDRRTTEKKLRASQAVPPDAPKTCRCESVRFELPAWLAEQCEAY